MLVSVDELRSYMGGLEPPDGMYNELALIISGLQQELENYLNRPVEPIQIRENVISDSKGCLYLGVTPVHKIISYGVNTVYAPEGIVGGLPSPMERDPILDPEARVVDKTNVNPNLLIPGGMRGLWPNTGYLVEYIGGYNGYATEAVKLALKRVAAREYSTNHVDTQGLRIGLFEQTEVGDQRYLGWAGEELKRLQRLRRRIVI
jgi:hypothetical protein